MAGKQKRKRRPLTQLEALSIVPDDGRPDDLCFYIPFETFRQIIRVHPWRWHEAEAVLDRWEHEEGGHELTWEDNEMIRDWQFNKEPREKRRHIPKAVRRAVLERDGRKCQHCGSTEHISLDHKKPYSLGGRHTRANLQVLCRSCNSRKGARVG
jgi:5-methylcytosine-specific restriction endonuclease McrA